MSMKIEKTARIDPDLLARQSQRFIERFETSIGLEHGDDTAWLQLSSIFRGLRRQLPLTESIELLNFLPHYIRSLYFENWLLSEDERPLITIEDFVGELVNGEPEQTGFPDLVDAIRSTCAFIDTLKQTSTNKKVVGTLPPGIRNLDVALRRAADRYRRGDYSLWRRADSLVQ